VNLAQIKPVNENTYVGVIPSMEYFREDTINIHFRFWYPPDGNGELKPIDLTHDIKPMWYLCPYNQFQNPVVEKQMLVSAVNKNMATVRLTSKDTQYLDFIKYTHQPVLETLEDNPSKFIRAEGSIMFNPHINGNI